MQYISSRQVVAAGDADVASGAPDTLWSWILGTLLFKQGTSSPMNGPIDSSPSQHPLIRSIHDGIYLHADYFFRIAKPLFLIAKDMQTTLQNAILQLRGSNPITSHQLASQFHLQLA
jgi:hypothetical protein